MIISIDLGGTRTKFGLVAGGKVLASANMDANPLGSLKEHLDKVLDETRLLAEKNGIDFASSEGIGIACTGLVNSQDRRVISTNGKYDEAVDFDFPKWAQQQAGLDIRIENDARAALIGEWCHGAGAGSDDLVMMTVGTGIGTAVITGGKVLIGHGFSAGNLGGHMIIHSRGRRCTCGSIGCLESEASGWVLPILVREHPLYPKSRLRDLSTIGFREILLHAAEGDGCAQAIQEHCLRIWGEAIVTFVHLYDPERVIVGGGIMNSSELVLESLRRTVANLAWPGKGAVQIVSAMHPDDAGLLGVAALFSPSLMVPE